jgi:hypothetical protein
MRTLPILEACAHTSQIPSSWPRVKFSDYRQANHPASSAVGQGSGLPSPAAIWKKAKRVSNRPLPVGGAAVSAFAMLGDILRPMSFAGLFGAAPSVALATLGIAIYQHGADYAALQSQAMIAGATALAAYSVVVCHLLVRTRLRALPATLPSLEGNSEPSGHVLV